MEYNLKTLLPTMRLIELTCMILTLVCLCRKYMSYKMQIKETLSNTIR